MKKRIAALLLCVGLCSVVVFSYAFIALESEHDCTDHHCHICLELQLCHALIRSLLHSGAAVAAVTYAVCLLVGGCVVTSYVRRAATPVSLKVKLLD